MQQHTHKLLSPSLGSQRSLNSLHFGQPGAGPKVYIQASLHADELPGMLVAHHLRQALTAAEAAGQVLGEVVLVPLANPIGLAQRLNHKALGRFEWDSAENFNRHYPDLAAAVLADVRTALGPDAASNTALVRQAVARHLDAQQPHTELQSLRHTLLRLAFDADVVLDLHCDCEAVMHLYTETACWPAIEPLARCLGCEAVLLAEESGGGPFDERLSGLWSKLARELQALGVNAPLPQGCASTTVELRGEADVDHTLARADAAAVVQYLQHMGALAMPPGSAALPALRCTATPLAGSQTLSTPVPGLLVYLAQPGRHMAVGEPVAEVIDPVSGATHRVCADVAGVFYARVRERYLHAGGEVGKIAGAHAFRQGNLLGA